MKTITRRTALRGAAAIAATGAVPITALASTNDVNADAELLALYAEYHRLRKSAAELRDRTQEAWFAVLEARPQAPGRIPYREFLERLKAPDSPYPALKKEKDGVRKAMFAALNRFLDTRANTAPGLFLKLTIEWFDHDHRAWEERGFASDNLGFGHEIMPSVLLDLQRLSGRKI